MRTTVPAPLLEPLAAARLLTAATEADEGLGTFTRLALVSGARRGELLGVRWPDLRWEAGSFVVACRGRREDRPRAADDRARPGDDGRTGCVALSAHGEGRNPGRRAR